MYVIRFINIHWMRSGRLTRFLAWSDLTRCRRGFLFLLACRHATILRRFFLRNRWMLLFHVFCRGCTRHRTWIRRARRRRLCRGNLHLPTHPHRRSYWCTLQFQNREGRNFRSWYRLHTIFLLCRQFLPYFQGSYWGRQCRTRLRCWGFWRSGYRWRAEICCWTGLRMRIGPRLSGFFLGLQFFHSGNFLHKCNDFCRTQGLHVHGAQCRNHRNMCIIRAQIWFLFPVGSRLDSSRRGSTYP